MIAKIFVVWSLGATIATLMDCQEQEVGTWDEVLFCCIKGMVLNWTLVIFYCIKWK